MLGAKIHYQNRKDVITYQAYLYIEIYFNQNEPIHCNARSKRNSLILWCYRVPTRTRIQHEMNTTRLYNTPIQHVNADSIHEIWIISTGRGYYHEIRIISTERGYFHEMRIISTENRYYRKMRIFPR